MTNITSGSYAGFEASCIHFIQPICFSVVVASQVMELSQSACPAIDESQMKMIPPSAVQGFQAQQIAVFGASGCAGLSIAQLSFISPTSFNGFQAHCISSMANDSFSQVTEAQLAALNDSACAGTHIELRTVVSFWVIGFHGKQIEVIPSAAFPGVQHQCIRHMSEYATKQFSEAQISNLTDTACTGFREAQISAFSNYTISYFRLDQLVKFPEGAISGFTAHQLLALVQKYGSPFVNLYSPSHVNGISVTVVSSYKPFVITGSYTFLFCPSTTNEQSLTFEQRLHQQKFFHP